MSWGMGKRMVAVAPVAIAFHSDVLEFGQVKDSLSLVEALGPELSSHRFLARLLQDFLPRSQESLLPLCLRRRLGYCGTREGRRHCALGQATAGVGAGKWHRVGLRSWLQPGRAAIPNAESGFFRLYIPCI